MLSRYSTLLLSFIKPIRHMQKKQNMFPMRFKQKFRDSVQWLKFLPGSVWKGIINIGRWIASIPRKTLETIKRLSGFIAGELVGLGKEFLEMIKNFFRLRTIPGKRISLIPFGNACTGCRDPGVPRTEPVRPCRSPGDYICRLEGKLLCARRWQYSN